MPLYDPNNVENCLAFLDAKRKLRIVLGSADFQVCIFFLELYKCQSLWILQCGGMCNLNFLCNQAIEIWIVNTYLPHTVETP